MNPDLLHQVLSHSERAVKKLGMLNFCPVYAYTTSQTPYRSYMLSFEACSVSRDACTDVSSDGVQTKVGVAGIKDEVTQKAEDLETVEKIIKIVEIAKIGQASSPIKAGVGSIVDKVTETAIKNDHQVPDVKVGAAQVAESIQKDLQDKQEDDDVIKIGVLGIKDAILETLPVQQRSQEVEPLEPVGAQKLVENIEKKIESDADDDADVIKIGVHGIKDAIIETVRVNQGQEVKGLYPVGAGKVVADVEKKLEASGETSNGDAFKVGAAAVVAAVEKKVEATSEASIFAAIGAAHVAHDIAQKLVAQEAAEPVVGTGKVVNAIAGKIAQGTEPSPGPVPDHLGAAGVVASVEKKLVDRQFENAQRIVNQMLHSVTGRPFQKPRKENEIEKFGDKIRVRVNRIKERPDFNRHDVEVNEVN